ncbi:MAG TPA: MBL fold metallo-hydrolase [Gemmatimonadaceae bacterium]|jgi:ribonuclease BN (tRNA processing enzyme)|nr:MBL fold metallo-hydrolase [Gemmatimonadaceae bacterium]
MRSLVGSVLFASVAGLAPARSSAPPAARVVVLGTGTPNADPERSGPAVAIVVGDAAYLVDAGPGVVRRAAQAARDDSIPALQPPRLRRVFLTHLHSDHTVGLPDLLLSPWVLGRTEPIEVFGPRGTRRMVGLLEQAYSEDVQIRLNGGEPSNKTGYAANAHDVGAGVIYRDSNVTITAFKVAHGKWDWAFGYRFATRDRVIVVSGDTSPTDAVVDACNGCDVLVHEVYSAERFRTRTPDWQRYHAAYHTSTDQLADIATRARPKLLVLYHQLYWGDDDAGLIRQVRAKYRGNVVSAQDLGVY